MTTTHRCLRLAAWGAALGVSWVAWAQEPSSAVDGPLDPTTATVVELAKIVGLPGVLAFLAFRAGRLIERMEIQVRLSDDDWRRLERLLSRGNDR